MHSDAADVTVSDLDLTGVEPCPHLDPDGVSLVAARLGAADPPGRPVECREHAVADRLHLASPMAVELTANQPVVLLKEVGPAPVPQGRRAFRRTDYVREQNGREHPIGLV